MSRLVAVLLSAAMVAAALAAPSWQEETALHESLVRDELDNRAVAV